MVVREKLYAIGGALVGLVVGVSPLAMGHLLPARPAPVPAVVVLPPALSSAEAGIDPAMIANINLTTSVVECTRKLQGALDDDTHLEQELEAAQNQDAGATAALERRISRRNLSPKAWKDLAKAGTVRYLLPCASFRPSDETLNRLGLAPSDVPVVADAFAAARDAAWTRLRPMCAGVVGNADQAERLGLDACPEVLLASARGVSETDVDEALRTVGSLKAGLTDPGAAPADATLGAALLGMTDIARDAESRIASRLGPEAARVIVYGSNGCSHMVELAGRAATATE
jgi:hypothetical protein